MKRHVQFTFSALLLAVPAFAVPTDDIPSHFIPGSECLDMAKPCECADLPAMKEFLDNQEAAKKTWVNLRTQTQMTGAPASGEDASKAFAASFASDPAVRLQFESCEDFDPEVNDAGRIAGGALSGGGALLDPCYCKTFCREVVESTIVHENAHLVFNLGVIGIYSSVGVACKAGLFDGPLCDGMDALAREGSEVYAYGKGDEALKAAMDEVLMQSPGMDCTTETPIEDASPEPSPELPSGLLDRLRMLGSRFIQGQ